MNQAARLKRAKEIGAEMLRLADNQEEEKWDRESCYYLAEVLNLIIEGMLSAKTPESAKKRCHDIWNTYTQARNPAEPELELEDEQDEEEIEFPYEEFLEFLGSEIKYP